MKNIRKKLLVLFSILSSVNLYGQFKEEEDLQSSKINPMEISFILNMQDKESSENSLLEEDHKRASDLVDDSLEKFDCECSKFTGTINDLKKHIKNCHKFDKFYICFTCNKFKKYVWLFISHLFKHKNLKPFKCKYCSYKTDYKNNLDRHEFDHKGIKPYKCSFRNCKYRDTQPYRIKLHGITHSCIKKFKCDECNFSCKRTNELKIHRLVHSGEMLQCNFFDCDFRCNQISNLRKHKLIKHFYCEKCKLFFKDKNESVEHKEKLHSRKRN